MVYATLQDIIKMKNVYHFVRKTQNGLVLLIYNAVSAEQAKEIVKFGWGESEL